MTNISWSHATVEEEHQTIEDRECVVMRQDFDQWSPDNPAAPSSIWWLDPEREYSIVRYESRSAAGNTQTQVDFSSTLDRRHGWVPTRWVIRRFQPDGTVASTVTAQVTDHEINPEFDEDAFRLIFPPGTHMN